MASVPTGMPAGICTVDRSESIPLSALDWIGHAEHGQECLGRGDAGQVRGPARARDDHLEPAALGTFDVLVHEGGGAVRRHRATSWGIPSASSAWDAWLMVSQSDLDPMMIATSGLDRGLGHRRVLYQGATSIRPSCPA